MRWAALLGLMVVLLAGCGSGVTASGNTRTESRPLTGFDSVRFDAAGTLTIDRTGTDSVEVTADEALLPRLTTEVTGTTLRIGLQSGTNASSLNSGDIRFRVTVAALTELEVSGAGDVTVTGVEGPALSVVQSGAGTITASGRVTTSSVELSGTGAYDGKGLAAENVTVSVSGAGGAEVSASATLDARVSGVGDVGYLGDPRVTREISGIGQVEKR
jgi:hypothetical protein